MNDQPITVTLSRADAEMAAAALEDAMARPYVYQRTLLHLRKAFDAVQAALAAPAEGPERAATGETLAFTIHLTYDDYDAFDDVLAEGSEALARDAELWEGRGIRSQNDRESIAFADRLRRSLTAAGDAFFRGEIAQQREEGRKLMEQKLAELRAAGVERGA